MGMTITLPLDAELAGLLAKQAAIQGVNVEQFALEALRRVAERPASDEFLAEARAESEASESNGQGRQQNTAPASASKPVPQVRRSTRGRIDLSKERAWVRQHRDEYRGQWVVLDGDRLIGHTPDAAEATAIFKQARGAGVRAPYVKLIPLDDEPIWMMWQ
jgi:hypothetical protein